MTTTENHYRITNETYGEGTVTLREFQAHADEMARTDETWCCRFAAQGATLVDELADDAVVGELATNGEIMAAANERLLAHSRDLCTPGCLGCMDRWQRGDS